MGAWGPGLFSDDLACDVRGEYRELIEDGVDDSEATRRVIERYDGSIRDPDEGPVFWLALAFTQSKIGRLDHAVKSRALTVIERGEGLGLWQHDPKLLTKRKATLERVRAQLTAPQPPRKHLRAPSRHVTDLVAGDVLVFRTGTRSAFLRVARIDEQRISVAPILVALDYEDAEPPSPALIVSLPDRREERQQIKGPPPAWYAITFRPMVFKRVDYRDAGFERIGRTNVRPGDEAIQPRLYLDWALLGQTLRGFLGADQRPAAQSD